MHIRLLGGRFLILLIISWPHAMLQVHLRKLILQVPSHGALQRHTIFPHIFHWNYDRYCGRRHFVLHSTNKVIGVGSEVYLKGGDKGIVLQKQKNGWLSVRMTDPSSSLTEREGQIIKVRNSEVELVNSSDYASYQGKANSERLLPISKSSTFDGEISVLLGEGGWEEPTDDSHNSYVRSIKPPTLHEQFDRWVVFSDLHVKAASIEICEQVLAMVHKAAVKRRAGIIFLGDFWHVRGSLNVELLNRVLQNLRKWEQPVIMIPGNHDQVTLGGNVHALEPLQYAFDREEQILLISEPSVCLGALWLPYRRDGQILHRILQKWDKFRDEYQASAIFCHADICGAFMNNNIRSRDGIQLSTFPADVPVYSGHFHKPHKLSSKNGASVIYVGSPYQTSLAEAGQDKYLYCLKTPQWREEERWIIDAGPKFIKAVSPKDPIIRTARYGDRVVAHVPVGEELEARKLLDSLRERSIGLELRYDTNPMKLLKAKNSEGRSSNHDSDSSPSAMEASEESKSPDSNLGIVDPLSVFHRYLNLLFDEKAQSTTAHDGSRRTEHTRLRARVMEEGQKILERLIDSEPALSASSDVRDLRIVEVRLRNFGPYGNSMITYPLAGRGLVLLRGQSADGTGADSNGSGKTTLAMSILWSLTGALDTRLAADSRPADVTHDALTSDGSRKSINGGNSTTAEVSVSGFINGQQFEVTRRRSSKKSELLFSLNNEILTTQSTKETQNLVDSILGVKGTLLQRCCFFGQHSHTHQSLLGLTDSKFRAELSSLVHLDLWIAAWQHVRSKEKEIKAKLNVLEVEMKMRTGELSRLNESYAAADCDVRDLRDQIQSSAHPHGGTNVAFINVEEEIRETESRLEDIYSKLSRYKGFELKTAMHMFLSATAQISETRSEDESELAQRREKNASLQAAVKEKERTMSAMSRQKRTVKDELSSLNATIMTICDNFQDVDEFSFLQSVSVANLNDASHMANINYKLLLEKREMCLSTLASVKFRKESVETNLRSLENVSSTIHTSDCKKRVNAIDTAIECPTCGQNFPYDAIAGRLEDARHLQAALLIEEAKTASESERLLHMIETFDKLIHILDKAARLQSQFDDLQSGHDHITNDLVIMKDEISKNNGYIESLLESMRCLDQDRLRQQMDAKKNLSQIEGEIMKLESQDMRLRANLRQLQKERDDAIRSRSAADATVIALNERLNRALKHFDSVEEQCNHVQNELKTAEKDVATFAETLIILEQLQALFGTKGIQNFIFRDTVQQLEGIANSYLQILTDSGIQLTLINNIDEDLITVQRRSGLDKRSEGIDISDRIFKSVWIRSPVDGILRERALSQLSGGQWRRVSLALDLAFVELVRSRGILRCNLVVMDEILTHLDAAGRETVGRLLRMITQSPSTSRIDTSKIHDEYRDYTSLSEDRAADDGIDVSRILYGSANAYETVIVILQDLAAAELEEAFDHIDTVRKSTDCATVAVDGVD